jgi:TPR repeat protein
MGPGSLLLKKAFVEMQKDKPDLQKAVELLNKSASKNNYEALYALGTWHLYGIYYKRSPVQAVKFFLEAIQGDISSAYFDLAVCYEKGIGIKKNQNQAFYCYLNAALLGDKQSLYEVGRCYFYGIGVAKNKKIALVWLNRADDI